MNIEMLVFSIILTIAIVFPSCSFAHAGNMNEQASLKNAQIDKIAQCNSMYP